MRKLSVVILILLAVSTAFTAAASDYLSEIEEMVKLSIFTDKLYIFTVVLDIIFGIAIITVTSLYIRDRRVYKYFMETTDIDTYGALEKDETEFLDRYRKLTHAQKQKDIKTHG